MKKKPELLKTGNLTVKRFIRNLKENNLHYENKKISQCVFLGVLRLKPVPGVFSTRATSVCIPTAANRLKSSLRNSPNVKKNTPVKNEVLTPKTSKKRRPERRFVPSRKPVVKIDLTCEETEVKTEYKFEKLKLNPVRVILHNINKTRGPMEEILKVEPPGEVFDDIQLEDDPKRMLLRPQHGRERSYDRSLSSSPILLDSFAETNYCFREAYPEVEKEIIVVSTEIKSKRTSPRFRTNSEENINDIIDVQEERSSRRRNRSSTSSNEELSEIMKKSKKIKTYERKTEFIEVGANNEGTDKKNVVLVQQDQSEMTLSVVSDTPILNLVREKWKDNFEKNVRLTRSKSQSPVYYKENKAKKRSQSMSPERESSAMNTRSKTLLDNFRNLAKTLKKPKLNPLSVDVRVKKEIMEERRSKRRKSDDITIKENPVLVSSPQKNVEHEELSDSEVELASPKNSPMKMVRSQRESTENLTEQDEQDIESIQKNSAREKIKKSNFVMEGEDTQVDIEEKIKKNTKTMRKRKEVLYKLSPEARQLKLRGLKKNPVASRLANIKKEKEETNKKATKVLPPRKRKSIYSKENLTIKQEPTDDNDSSTSSEIAEPRKRKKRRRSEIEDTKKRKQIKKDEIETELEKIHSEDAVAPPKKPKATKINPAVVETRPRRGRKPKIAQTDMNEVFTNITKEIEVTPLYGKKEEEIIKKNEGNMSDSDAESRSEWMPEDYADYKRNFEKKRKKGTSKNQGRVFKCKICLMMFPSYYKLRKHDKDHQNVEKPYECTLCDQSFKDVLDLTAHIKIHKGKHPYQCRKCEKGFWEKDAYEKHLPVHILKKNKPPENRFRCDVCAKEFAKLCDMERHLRVHTGEKPCICNICHKRFQQSHNLSKHLLTHLQVKPFHCEICNKKFGRIDVLNRHLMIHSVEKPFSCPHCSKGFIRLCQLEQHTKNKHPHLLEGMEAIEESVDDVDSME